MEQVVPDSYFSEIDPPGEGQESGPKGTLFIISTGPLFIIVFMAQFMSRHPSIFFSLARPSAPSRVPLML